MTRPGLLTLAVLGAALLLLPSALLLMGQRGEMENLRHDFAAYSAQAAQRPKAEAELAALKAAGPANGLVTGTNSSLAQAALQGAVKQVVEAQGGRIQSAQNLPSQLAGPMEKISLRYEMSVPPGRFQAVLYALETSVPWVTLDDIDIVMPESFITEGVPSAAPNLNLHWTVQSWRWAGTQ